MTTHPRISILAFSATLLALFANASLSYAQFRSEIIFPLQGTRWPGNQTRLD